MEANKLFSISRWVPGRLEVIPCHACLLQFDVLTAGAAWLSKWDINHTVSQVAKNEPLYNDMMSDPGDVVCVRVYV